MKRLVLLAVTLIVCVGCRDDGDESPTSAATPAPAATTEAVTPPKVVLTLPAAEEEAPAEPAFRLVMGEATVEVDTPKRAGRARTTRGARPTGQKAAASSVRRVSIMGTIRANWSDVERCYGNAVAKDSSLAGKITFKWTLGAKGVPSAVSVVRDTLADKGVGNCIRKRAKSWQFPPPRGGVGVVKYTYDLRTQ